MKSFVSRAIVAPVLLLAACGGAAAPSAPASSPAPASAAKPATSAPASAAAASAKPAASASASAKPAPKPVPGKLNIAYSNIAGSNLAAWSAQDGGYFQKNGVEVAMQLVSGGSRTMAALLSGDEQLILAGGAETVSAVAQGTDLVIVGTLGPVYPYKFEVTKDIKTADDLKGKTIGVASFGGSADIATRVVLRRLKLDPEKDVSIISLSDSQTRSAALLTGKVQGGMDSPPGTIKLEAAGLHTLVNLASEQIPAANDTIVGQRSWITAHKADVQKVVDSLVQGAVRAKNDKAFGLATLKKYYKDEKDDEMVPSYEFYANETMPALPYAKPEQFKDAIETLSVKNEKVKGFDVNKIIDNSFVKSAADRGLDKG
ncbi:MAG TPA: ABC transporter substrate-binding protein [Chloroflexota bacterium]|jgi:NitT/TauT family transport system substrate-binding protein